MKFLSYLKEIYVGLVANTIAQESFPVFKNPSSSELRDILKSGKIDPRLVRFVCTADDVYVASYILLHVFMIRKLKLRGSVLFRGNGRIEGSKIEIFDLRVKDINIKGTKYPWESTFSNWKEAYESRNIDASVL